jgi:hypothetical protein
VTTARCSWRTSCARPVTTTSTSRPPGTSASCQSPTAAPAARARKDGNAEKIAAAVERERQAYAVFMAVSDASIKEMFVINGASLERLGHFFEQMDRAWAPTRLRRLYPTTIVGRDPAGRRCA